MRSTFSKKDEVMTKATLDKSAFRMEYAITTHIQASVSRVWALMTDAANFPRWNSTVKSIEGKIALGQTIKLIAVITPERTFNLNVIEFTPEKQMVWSDGNFMFKGVRTYTFTPKSDGSTDFSMAEAYTGLMLPLIAGPLPDFRPTFEQYASDLKRAAEQG
jgi:hypothetical protein